MACKKQLLINRTLDGSVFYTGADSTRLGQMLLFVKNFFKHPKMLGTPIPSPGLLIEAVLERINWQKARVIVEYGPGVGTITAEILRRMHPQARLVAIETNAEFVRFVRESLPDPRLHTLQGSAADVDVLLARAGCRRADCVISGIPFSTIPVAAREGIVRATHTVLQPEGIFLVYQYTRQVVPTLEKIFGRVRRDFMLLKLMPVWLFHCLR